MCPASLGGVRNSEGDRTNADQGTTDHSPRGNLFILGAQIRRTNGITDMIVCSPAHGQIYSLTVTRQTLSFISGRRDGCALT